MAEIAKNDNNKTPINWNNETKDVMKKIGKVLFKVLTYFFNIFLTLLLIVFIIGIIVGSTFAIYIKNYVDADIDASLLVNAGTNKTTQLFYTDRETGEVVEIEDQRIYGADNGIWVSYDDMPKQLIDAFIAIEDDRFYSHNGVDWITTSKAFLNYFVPFAGNEFGGSTITQQLVKNLTGDSEAKISRKVQEIFRALNLEKELSKEQIIEMYLNVIFFGNNCTGVQTAADTYFGKDVSELSVEECATLAGIVKNPYAYNPVRYPEKCKERRNDVIWAMQDQNKISEAEADAIYDHPIKLVEKEVGEAEEVVGDTVFSWYTESVFNEVQQDLMDAYGYSKYSAGMAIYTGGLKIYTCMDPEVQSVLEEVYTNDTDYFPMSYSSMQPESAMVICEPYTGDVLGLVGGRGEKLTNRILNRATGTIRPPGSSIKPVAVYAPAIEEGIITYASVYDDVPVNFGPNNNSRAWPQNLPVVYRGLTNINSAIERSVNTIAVRVLQDLTPEKSYEFVTKKLDFTTVYDNITTASGATLSDVDYSPLALGQLTYGISVKELTASYCMFQNDGVLNNSRLYTKVLNSSNEVILSKELDPEIVLSEQNACIMTKMLYNVVNDPEGTAVGSITLKNSVDVAGKTGTSSSDFDRWFVGYTPYYVGGCWFGYDTNIALSAFGPNPACIVWDKVMTILHQKYIDEAANGGEPIKKFETAVGVFQAEYCVDSGMLVSDACRLDLRGSRVETGWFAYGTEPSEYCTTHVKVKYCNEYNRVASPKCTNTREVGLVRIDDRSFPYEITVWDAQYAYRYLPPDVRPGGWYGHPFFKNLLAEGEFCGMSGTEYQANSYCYDHGFN